MTVCCDSALLKLPNDKELKSEWGSGEASEWKIWKVIETLNVFLFFFISEAAKTPLNIRHGSGAVHADNVTKSQLSEHNSSRVNSTAAHKGLPAV